jgi:VCBS repeat-containing protein
MGTSTTYTATGSTTDSDVANAFVFVQGPLSYSTGQGGAATVTSFDVHLSSQSGSDVLSIQNHTSTWDGNTENVTTSGDNVYLNNTLVGTYSFSNQDLVFTFSFGNSNPDVLGAIMDAVAYQNTATVRSSEAETVSFSFGTSSGSASAPSATVSVGPLIVPVTTPVLVQFNPVTSTVTTYPGSPVSIFGPSVNVNASPGTYENSLGQFNTYDLYAIGMTATILNPQVGDELLFSSSIKSSLGAEGDSVTISDAGTKITFIEGAAELLDTPSFDVFLEGIQYENTSSTPPSTAQIEIGFVNFAETVVLGGPTSGYPASVPITTPSPIVTVDLTPLPTVMTESATVATGAAVSGSAGTTGTGALANDSDATAGYTLSVSAVTGGTLGSAVHGTYGDLTLNADGSFSYTAGATSAEIAAIAAASGQVIDAFTFSVSDGHGGVSPSTLDIKLDATPPSATSAQFAFGGNDLAAGAQGTITLAVSDLGALNTTGGSPTLTLNDGGTATYDAAASTLTSLVFDYQVAGSDSNVAALGVSALNLGGATATNSSGVPVDDISVAGLTGSGPQIDTTNSVSSGTIALGGFSTSDSIYDSQTVAPFGAIAVSDSAADAQDSATIAFAAANGSLSGAGLSAGVVSNGTVTYSLSATTPEALQAELRVLVFTPIAQPSAGAPVTTSFDLSVTDVPTASATPIATLSATIPGALATDSAGDVYVTDGADSVEEFSSSGALLRTLSTGENPVSLATDAAGDVFVANEFSSTVEKFSSSGVLLMTLSTGTDTGAFSVGADAAGDVLVTTTGQQTLEEFSSSGAPESAPPSHNFEDVIASAGDDIFFDSPTNADNIDFNGIVAVSGSGAVLAILGMPSLTGAFAVSTDGAVYFVGTDSNIYKSTFTGSEFSTIQPFVSGADHTGPIAVDAFGDLYAVNDGSDPQQVDEFSSSGVLLRTLSIGSASVLSLTTDQAGDIFIGTSNNQVLEFAPLGASTVSDSTTTVTVTPAVTALAETATIASGGVVSGTMGTTGTGALAGDSDATGYGLSVSAIAGGTLGAAMHGTYGDLTLNADGSFSYTAGATSAEIADIAAASGQVTDAFTFSVSDGHGGVTSSTLDIKLDASKPSISSIGFSPSSGHLAVGASETITLSLGDTGAIDIAGNGPTLTLNDGGTATYDAAASTGTSLVFDYTVGLNDTDVSSLAVSLVNLNGTTLTNASDVATATSLSVSGVTQSGPEIDTTKLTGATALPSSGIYGPGETMGLILEFDKAVTATGPITLSLNDGGTATLDAASTAALEQFGLVAFDYKVAPTDHDVSSLAITGVDLGSSGTIIDSFGHEAQFVGALPTFANIEIDTGVACYRRGTLIEIARGQQNVETLQIGDRVRTASGALRPIKWIGRRSYAGRFIMGRKDILPVCIKAGALGENLPERDLWVSPNHAMYLSRVLIEAKDLINGVSIVQAERVESLEYFHIELDSHDVIIAEGALAETFIDDDSRGMFHNAHDYDTLYDEEHSAPAHYCAPRLNEGYEVEAVRRRLALRAGLLRAADGPRLGALRGNVDLGSDNCIAGWAQNIDAPEAPVCLDILIEGKAIGQVLANGYRDDLEAAGLGSGRHGFAFTPPRGLDFAADAVEVRRSLDGAALERSNRASGARRNITVHRRAAHG